MSPARTILAATDFSDPSRAALVFAARMARHHQAALHVVHAEHPLLDAAAGHSGVDLAAQTREEPRNRVSARSTGGYRRARPIVHRFLCWAKRPPTLAAERRELLPIACYRWRTPRTDVRRLVHERCDDGAGSVRRDSHDATQHQHLQSGPPPAVTGDRGTRDAHSKERRHREHCRPDQPASGARR